MLEMNHIPRSKNNNNQESIDYLATEALEWDMNELSELYKKCYKSSSGKPMQKYKKGSNVWSGRGRMPLWVREHLDLGGTLDDMLTPVAIYHRIMQLQGEL